MIRYLVVRDDWSRPEIIEEDSRLAIASVAAKHSAAKPGVRFRVVELKTPYHPAIIDEHGNGLRVTP